nr:daptide biosynthesis intramembrane metalloprotease [Sinomonas susongensis]
MGEPWILAVAGVPKARVSGDVAKVLAILDGRRDAAEVAQYLGSPWTSDDVVQIVRQLVHTGAFDLNARPKTISRIQFRAPLTVQVTLFNPTPFLHFLRPGVAAMARPLTLTFALVFAGGIIGAFAAGPDLCRVLATPLPLESYLWVAAAMFLSTLLHEFGHGMALVYFGGTPRRIGIMLFYLTPAFFCDVTDGWRLGSSRQRVAVALAGPLVHLGLGSVALVAQGILPPTPYRDAAILFGVICYAVAILNLVPFIKLDGYVALMSAVNVPHLRRKSLTALDDVVSSRILGSRVESRSRGLLASFGLASFVSGVAFMIIGFQRTAVLLQQLGYVGRGIVLIVLCLLILLALKGIYRFFKSASMRGSPLWRRLTVLVLGTAAAAGLLAVIPVKPVVVAGYSYTDGELRIVVPVDSSAGSIDPGDRVALQSQGMVIHADLARATIGTEPPSDSSAPLDALIPVTLADTTIPVRAYPARVEAPGSLPTRGRAEVTSQKEVFLGEWLCDSVSSSLPWAVGRGQG